MIQIVQKPLYKVFSTLHHMIMQAFQKGDAKAVQK